MKLLYVSFLHPEMHAGGAQQIAYEMFQAARRAGHDATFIAAITPGLWKGPQLDSAIKPFSGRPGEFVFCPRQYEFDQFSVLSGSCLLEWAAFLERSKPDVVHFHHYHGIGLEALRLAEKPGRRIIMHLHEMLAICRRNGQMVHASGDLCDAATPVRCSAYTPDKTPAYFEDRTTTIKAAFASVDKFVAPSRYLRDIYVNWGLTSERIAVIENGTAAPPGASRLPPSDQLNRFGYFGQLLDAKGLPVIFKALDAIAATANHRPLKFEINGGNLGFASKAFQEHVLSFKSKLPLLAEKGIEITFRGPYNRSGLASRMAAVDWVIVPSTWGETFALVLSEAWLFGRVPIASSIGALKERIQDRHNGLLFPAGDGVALARVILECAGNHELFSRLRQHLPRITTDAEMVAAHEAVYRPVGQRQTDATN